MIRVVFVTSQPAGNAARILHYLVRTKSDEITVAGALIDANSQSDRRRQLRRIRAWNRHGGISYVAWRLWLNAKPKIGRAAPRARYHRSLQELGQEFHFPVITVPTVNSTAAEDGLRSFDADLGISISNRIIAKRIFTVPRLGMINLHHGHIPLYRGGPPAFWELYDGVPTMGVSVHRIDEKLDHGSLLARGEVPVESDDDTTSLYARALNLDYRLVTEGVALVAAGTPDTIAVDFSQGGVRTIPSRQEVREVERRLGRKVEPDGYRQAPLVEISVPDEGSGRTSSG